ncbi:olfactory receptor 1419 [Mus musculus]|jgi:olfactory receptor|uniref:Olfactory receptor n=2 Tax=Mus TaxID=862507 RepID=Q7TQS2_MOUSE|nr:olfactory receptor 1419 [Mus musculus]AAI47201.1 Olfactory receptor 1419 [Mus musculus]AAI47202.1 Olfactory receptor 1419 [Mus musculus]AAP71797.1 olfactory receptor Olfr1419 [Mus musculus]|eukprot:NP_001011775.1 olfactory receptor 1419 [Mus musculus]
MEEENQTGVVYFHFRPFSTNSTVASLVFVGFLLLYLGSLIGNLTIGLTVWQDHSLHTPMYFFLFVLATLELGYSTNIAPLTLASILSMGKMLISLPSCGAQMFFFILLGGSDCVLLAIMAYDRYVAICHPLHYSLIMSWQLCGQMALGSLGLGFLLSLPLTILICHLPFCGHNEIYHFFCDMPAVMRLACTDTHIHQAALFAISVAAVAIPFLLICLSYGCIVATILRMTSAEGKRRAFSTCSSHLLVVVLQYGCCTLIYLRPSSSYSPEEGRAVSVVYTFFSPLLNPLIYSLRNQEVTDAVKRLLTRMFWFRKPERFLPGGNYSLNKGEHSMMEKKLKINRP